MKSATLIYMSNKWQRRHVLEEGEIPEILRDLFDFSNQYIPDHRPALFVKRVCSRCGDSFGTAVSDVRKSLKRGKLTGMCWKCWHGPGEHKRGPINIRHVNAQGYRMVYLPDHPSGQASGHILEHRVIMELKLGRYLTREEQVHHLNGKRDDNRPENLELWKRSQPPGIRAEDYHCPGCRCTIGNP